MPFVPLLERPGVQRWLRLPKYGSSWLQLGLGFLGIALGASALGGGERWSGLILIASGAGYVVLAVVECRRILARLAAAPADAVFCRLVGLRLPWRPFRGSVVAGLLTVGVDGVSWSPIHPAKWRPPEAQQFTHPWPNVKAASVEQSSGPESSFDLTDNAGATRAFRTIDGAELERAIVQGRAQG